MPATQTAATDSNLFTVIDTYGDADFGTISAAMEHAFLFESFGRKVSVCGPRGWVYVNGRFVGDLAK
jgi:hypothetical protein